MSMPVLYSNDIGTQDPDYPIATYLANPPSFDDYSNILQANGERLMQYQVTDTSTDLNFIMLLYYQDFYIGCDISPTEADAGKCFHNCSDNILCRSTLLRYQ